MIVVDASVIVTGLGDDGDDGARVLARLRTERLVAPHVIDLEVVSAWRRLVAAGLLDDRRSTLALADLGSLRSRARARLARGTASPVPNGSSESIGNHAYFIWSVADLLRGTTSSPSMARR